MDTREKIVVISNEEFYFFSTDHCQKHKLGSDYVPVTHYLPSYVVARESVPDGIVKTKEDVVAVFYHKLKEIPNPDSNFKPKRKLTIAEQIEVIKEVKVEIKQNEPVDGLCWVFVDTLNKKHHLCVCLSHEATEYIPGFTRENAAILAKKYKFKKAYQEGDGAYWWNTSASHYKEKRIGGVDVKNRICFLNALIKQLESQL